MPVELSAIALNPKLYDEYTGSGGGGVDFLLGAIGDKITAEIQFDVYWKAEDIPCTFSQADGTITRTDIMTLPMQLVPMLSFSAASWKNDEFKVGNTITISDTALNNGTFTITALTDTVMTVAEALVDETATAANFYGDTPITAVDFYFNILENSLGEDYKSTVDNVSENHYNCGTCAIPMASTLMTTIGESKGWKIGSAYIDDVSLTNHVQKFKITHTFYITPFFLSGWLSNLQNGTNPKGFYKNGESLKYFCKIECKYSNASAEPEHYSDFFDEFKKGNVGFYDEHLNGYDANYTLKSITFWDVPTGLNVDTVQYGRDTDVEIRLTSVHSVFAAGCECSLVQLYLPQLTTEYVDTGSSLMFENFWGDKVFLTEGAASKNGDNYGTDYQIFTNVRMTLINASEIKIEYRVILSDAFDTFIDAKAASDRYYLLFATPQDIAVTTTSGTDRNAVICDCDIYTADKNDNSLFQIIGSDIFFHEYPDELMVDYTDYRGFSADTALVRGMFRVESLSDVELTRLTFKIEATKVYHTNVVLETLDINMRAFPPDKDLVQNIDFTQDTNFKTDDNSIYANYKVARNEADDTGNYIAYYFEYPFRLRYETWVELISQEFPNGTHDWHAYEEDGWQLVFNIYATVYDNVNEWENEFLHTSYLYINTFDEPVEKLKVSCKIETYNAAETENLYGMVQSDEDTVVVATFTGNFNAIPTGFTAYYGYLLIDSPEIGGIFYNQMCSTEEDVLQNGIWKGYTADRAVLTVVNTDQITLKGIIDYTKLPDLPGGVAPLNYLCFGARIGYLNDLGLILCEDESPIITEDMDGLIQE